MTTPSLLVPQVKRLLSLLCEGGETHLSEIEADLGQTHFLLAGAIEKLGASFLALHAATQAQQSLVEAVLGDAPASPELHAQLRLQRLEIERQVNAAVTGLQFQDMTSQLISRMATRISGLRVALEGANHGGASLSASTGAAELAASLETIERAVRECGDRLDISKTVPQTRMECGDVELF